MEPEKPKLLIVDDEVNLIKVLKVNLSHKYHVLSSLNGNEAWEIIQKQNIDVILSDLKLPGMDGITLLEKTKSIDPQIPIILITAYGTIETAVEAMKKGAFDYLLKPLKIKEVEIVLDRALRHYRLIKENLQLRKELNKYYGFENIVTADPSTEKLIKVSTQIAQSTEPVLVEGESGTGKELFARAIHQNSPHSKGPFIDINCAAIPQQLLETELFGHEKGAFTGAFYTKKGKFEMAKNGTLLLDEIAEMPFPLQSKILRAIEQYEINRIGGINPIKINPRLICTTNKDLKQEVKKGNFRDDLFYRLNVLYIKIPPLREKISDIPLLVNHFINKYKNLSKSLPVNLSPEVLEIFSLYSWPGNIRELENCLKRMIILSPDGNLHSNSIPDEIFSEVKNQGIYPLQKETLKFSKKLARQKAAAEVEKKFIISLLSKNKGNISKSSREAGMNRRQFQALLKKNNIYPVHFKP